MYKGRLVWQFACRDRNEILQSPLILWWDYHTVWGQRWYFFGHRFPRRPGWGNRQPYSSTFEEMPDVVDSVVGQDQSFETETKYRHVSHVLKNQGKFLGSCNNHY